MDLTQIKYFLALAETLNFTRAAEACNVTQPALTKSIQKLEDELGGPLLLRERRDSQLTELGRTMVPLLQHTYDAANAARLGATQFHRQDVARVRIGLGPWVPPDSIVPLLRELNSTFPTLEVSVRHGGTATLNDWLVGSEIDVAFTVDGDRLTSRANAWSLFEDDVVALLNAGHVLAQQPAPLAVEELSNQSLVGRLGPEEAPRAFAGMSARVRHLGTTEEHVWSLLRSGLGITLSTARRLAPGDIVCRPLHPRRSLAIHMATIPGRRPTPAVDAFVRLARARDWKMVTT
jgi:DNA-binding transcriptional LysR family regulator